MVGLDAWLTAVISFVGAILIPIMVLLWRSAVNGTKYRDQIVSIARDLERLVKDKDQVHQEIINQMRDDRNATNLRLRWLEENVWNTTKRRSARGDGP